MEANNFSPFDFFFCCSHLTKSMHRKRRGVKNKKFYLNLPDKSGEVYLDVKNRGYRHEFFAVIKNDKITTLDVRFDDEKTNGNASSYDSELDKCEQFVHFLDSLIEWKDVAKEVKGFLPDPTSQKNNWLKTTTVML